MIVENDCLILHILQRDDGATREEGAIYSQVPLTVAHLRLRPADPNTSASLDPSEYVPVDSLSQALVTAFKESFPLARNALKKYGDPALVDQKQSALDAQMLDASRIRLDHAFLARSDLKGVLMRGAFLIGTNLRRADLREALLNRADLREADLRGAD